MKKTLKTLAVILTLILLLCACGKTKGTESKPSNDKDNVSSYSDSSVSDDVSSEADDLSGSDTSDDDYLDLDLSDDKENNNDDSDEEDDEEEEEYIIPPYIQEYEDTGIHNPVKVLTPAEMIEKCIKDGLKVKETVIKIGLNKPVKIARITDSHLAYVNGADNAIAREQASIRYQYYVDADKKLSRCVNYAKASGVDLVAFTGDIWDFFSMGNLYKFSQATKVLDDFLFSIGNHEDIRKVGGNLSTGDDFTLLRNTISQYVKGDLSFDTRDLGEVTVVSMDNSRYTFDANQVEKMKAEIAKGKPILIMMHVPLYTDELFEVAKENNDTGSIMGKTMTGATKEMVELINDNPDIIKGIFAGHLHYDHTSETTGGITQHLLRASVQEKGFIEIIEVK